MRTPENRLQYGTCQHLCAEYYIPNAGIDQYSDHNLLLEFSVTRLMITTVIDIDHK